MVRAGYAGTGLGNILSESGNSARLHGRWICVHSVLVLHLFVKVKESSNWYIKIENASRYGTMVKLLLM